MVDPAHRDCGRSRTHEGGGKLVQPGLIGLIDGTISTLAPIFASAYVAGSHAALLVGFAAALGAAISMGMSEALSDDGALTAHRGAGDAEALEGFGLCSRLEGILPALETAHAVVEGMRQAAKRSHEDVVVICFSGRGDKDCFEVARLQGEEIEG